MSVQSNTIDPRAQHYLKNRLDQVDKGLGKLAARLPAPAPLTPEQMSVTRAREIIGDLSREVRVRSLEAAIEGRLNWLARSIERTARADGEPKPLMTVPELDIAILKDLLSGWQQHTTNNQK